jgi:UDP-glucose 4-epimerase
MDHAGVDGGGRVREVLITGDSGFVGSNLREYMRRVGWEVRGWSLPRDICDNWAEAALAREMRGCDAVIHLAAASGVTTTRDEAVRVNVEGSLAVFGAAARAGVRRVVAASTVGDLASSEMPSTAYGRSKLVMESKLRDVCDAASVSWCALRLSNVYGPRSEHKETLVANALRAARDDITLEVRGDGEQTRDWLFVGDACVALERAAREVFCGVASIGYGQSYSVNQVLDVVELVTERKVRVHYRYQREGDLPDVSVDASVARKAFGWFACVDIEGGVRETWEWLGA